MAKIQDLLDQYTQQLQNEQKTKQVINNNACPYCDPPRCPHCGRHQYPVAPYTTYC